MKKLLTIGICLLAVSAFAIKDQKLPTGGAFYDGTINEAQTNNDTNTDTTLLTPRYVGDLLLGKTGGTNSIWVARGITSNDWGLVTALSGKFGNDNLNADVGVDKLVVAAAKIIVGNAAGAGAAQTVSGVIVITTNGVTSFVDTDLNTWAGITPSANAQALLVLDYSAMRTNLSLVIGSNVQAYDADLDKLAKNDAGSLTNVVDAGIIGMSADKLTAGSTASAIDGSSITNIADAGIVSLDASKLTGNMDLGRLTNAAGVAAAMITVTNYGVGDLYGTNVITFFGTVSYP